jgi:para-nitrobenzyl esterase
MPVAGVPIPRGQLHLRGPAAASDHTATIPFKNRDIVLGRAIRPDIPGRAGKAGRCDARRIPLWAEHVAASRPEQMELSVTRPMARVEGALRDAMGDHVPITLDAGELAALHAVSAATLGRVLRVPGWTNTSRGFLFVRSSGMLPGRTCGRTAMSSVVETASGKVRGSVVEGVLEFRTIPYAASTAGANRFRPPQPVPPWSGVRDCLEFNGRAPQAGLRQPTRPELENFSGAADTSPETEDCLTVNVWTPACQGDRPVMVWFHGGAFAYGNANSPRTRGSRLAARNDVVVVTVNQRLNIFGHLDLSAVGGDRHSGNAGTLDMVASLQWVRDNIAAFGGDPGNVTIFGESGGGAKVSTLLSMPLAKGLFHRAIIQSGAAVRLRTRDRAIALTEIVLKHLGATAVTIADVPADHLLAAIDPAQAALGPSQTPLFDRYPFGPVVDGDVLPAQPFDPVASGISADVPLIIGDMKTETANFLAVVDQVWSRSLNATEMRQRVTAIAGAHAGRVVELYEQLYPGLNPAERLIAITTDSNFRIRSLALAQRRAALHRGPVWMYSFDWETPVLGGKLKAPHAMDVPFVFNTLDLTNATGGSAEASTLAGTMSSVWAAFARNGRPDHPSIPAWPVYDAASRATLLLDKQCRIENDPRGEERRLWQDITGTA